MDKTTIKLQIAANGKTQARTDAAWGTEPGALNR